MQGTTHRSATRHIRVERALVIALMMCAFGCGDTQKPHARSGDSPATTDPAPKPSPDEPPVAHSGTGDDNGAKPGDGDSKPSAFDPSVQQIVEGKSCASYGKQISPSPERSFERTGNVFSRSEFWGCGCSTGPEFTLVYEPNTSPLRVRLCHDEGKDPCEAGCRQVLQWDLSAALAGTKTKEVEFPSP